jgi:mono/diheme cytochrome c family protein
VDPSDPTKPAATLVPYDVSSPLWSDGASKQRYFALPDDTTIHVKDCSDDAAECKDPSEGGSYEEEGDWGFPDGTVFMKTFAFEGKLVETRLLQKRDDDNWWGYSYEWHEDQADAELVDSDGADAMVAGPDGMLNWHFPSRSQCLQCHTTASGISLGLETSQLNFDFTYPNGARGNQVVTLEHAGFFEGSPALRPVYPAPSDATLALEARARSYLHSNCAMCHRPGGNFTDFDARFSTALEDTELCNVDPDKAIPPDITVTNPKRIAAGDPASSVVSLRMHSLDPNFRMPQIGSRVVDEPGAKVVDDWISSLTDCP